MKKYLYPLIIVGIVLILAGLMYASLRYWEKEAWDWIELLIVPAALALVAVWFNYQGRKDDIKAAAERARIDHEIAADRQHEAALQTYYDKMTELLLQEDLRIVPPGTEAISIALSRTRATLRSLDHARKGLLVEFLHEARLIEKQNTVIDLDGADLTGAELMGADLRKGELAGANLTGANLSAVDLSEADLNGADLSYADISQADLTAANLEKVQLFSANLSRAVLTGASLAGADLSKANLTDAELKDTNLNDALLDEASLFDATSIGFQQLAQAASLKQTILPDGKRYDPQTHPEINRLRQAAGLPPLTS